MFLHVKSFAPTITCTLPDHLYSNFSINEPGAKLKKNPIFLPIFFTLHVLKKHKPAVFYKYPGLTHVFFKD